MEELTRERGKQRIIKILVLAVGAGCTLYRGRDADRIAVVYRRRALGYIAMRLVHILLVFLRSVPLPSLVGPFLLSILLLSFVGCADNVTCNMVITVERSGALRGCWTSWHSL